MKNKRNDIAFLATLLVSLIVIGTVGYKILLETSLIDALYMTVITISTVGYGEIAVMDEEAKIFSIILIFISLGTVGYLFSAIVTSLLEGDVKKAWRRRKMVSAINHMKDHYIICGAGETAYNAMKQFLASQASFIVIDQNEEKINELIEENIPAILGDATHEEILEKANISTAKGLISTLPKDADNVYTVLTARQLNPDIYIVSRAIEKNAAEKLKKAGANNTISPNQIGGSRMASILLRPNVISFLDVITLAGDVILDLEEVTINRGSELINQNLREAQIPQRTGLTVLALKKPGESQLIFNPNPDLPLEEGETMIVLGQEEQVNVLKSIAEDF